MRLRATPSSAQARQAAERRFSAFFGNRSSCSPAVTGVCGRGDHDECSGRVYVGHSFEDGAQYDPCGCDCHTETEKRAA